MSDRDRSIDRFLPMRPVELDIVLSLAAGPRHGYGIIQDSEEREGSRTPDVGTMYRALRRMQDQGLIGESGPKRVPDGGDERRHYYHLTPLGLRVARAEARRLEGLVRMARLGGLLEEKGR